MLIRPVKTPDVSFSVMRSSEYQDAAWKFISNYFTDEYQKYCDWSVLKKYSENGELTVRENNPYRYSDQIWADDERIELDEPDEKSKEMIRTYMTSDMAELVYDSDIMSIIYEEYTKFSNGAQDVNETASNVQKRVQICLCERG